MTTDDAHEMSRYARQIAFEPLGLEGQRRLRAATALIVGVGGLGSWTAELLCRAGVGRLRLVDGDVVESANLHRQCLYDDADAAARRPKAEAAAGRLRQINRDVRIEAVVARLDASNVAGLADGVGVICDGTDNFATRFILNDYAVRTGLPWVFAGVVGGEGQVMPVSPGRTACLRCVYDCPPTASEELAPLAMGVLGPAVSAIASMSALEAMRILAGRADEDAGGLLKFDMWAHTSVRLGAGGRPRPGCVCCDLGKFEHLQA